VSSYSVQSFMDNLPAPIEKNEHLNQLAEVAARIFQVYSPKIRLACLYSEIDHLDEAILDIMARDFKVDWYDYDGNLETKRRQIKDNWYIHKRLGSVRAVERALSDTWMNTTVEEWFQYDGDPYHFRIIFDASEDLNPIHVNEGYKKVYMYKPARAWLEDDEVIVRVSFGIIVHTGKFSAKYHTPSTGTRPRWATHGNKSKSDIIVETDSLSGKYHSLMTGQMTTGLHPNVATHGRDDDGDLIIDADGGLAQYSTRPCGTPLNSLM